MTGMLISDELFAAVSAEREREVQGLLREREARRSPDVPARRNGRWVWRVEPGMEEAFTSLRAWLLSRVDEKQIEGAAGSRGPS